MILSMLVLNIAFLGDTWKKWFCWSI